MKWGIIGAGNIAKRFAQSQKHIENSCIYPLMMLYVNTFCQNEILSVMFSRIGTKPTVYGYITVIILFTFPK